MVILIEEWPSHFWIQPVTGVRVAHLAQRHAPFAEEGRHHVREAARLHVTGDPEDEDSLVKDFRWSGASLTTHRWYIAYGMTEVAWMPFDDAPPRPPRTDPDRAPPAAPRHPSPESATALVQHPAGLGEPDSFSQLIELFDRIEQSHQFAGHMCQTGLWTPQDTNTLSHRCTPPC